MSTVAMRVPASTFRRRRATAMLVVAALAAAVYMLAGIGGGGRSGPLAWSGDPEVFDHPTLPGDRVLSARLRNNGSRPLRVDIGDVRLVNADGALVDSAPVFMQVFGTSPWAGSPPASDSELERTGRIAALSPGEQIPLTVAWHAADGDPARVDYGSGWLALPGVVSR